MRNKNVGFLIVGISVLIVAIVMIFNIGLQNIVETTCDHGPSCVMYDTISMQTNLSLAVAGLVDPVRVSKFLIFLC